MAYVIEIDGERFEGADEKSARNAYRRKQRELAKSEQIARTAHKLATMRAEVAGYRVLSRLADTDAPFPRGWSIRIVGEPNSSHKIEYRPGGWASVFITEDGQGSWHWPIEESTRIIGCLENGAGYVMAIFIDTEDAKAFSVGVAETEDGKETIGAIAFLLGVTIEKVRARIDAQKEKRSCP